MYQNCQGDTDLYIMMFMGACFGLMIKISPASDYYSDSTQAESGNRDAHFRTLRGAYLGALRAVNPYEKMIKGVTLSDINGVNTFVKPPAIIALWYIKTLWSSVLEELENPLPR
jgi:hypothetical protein